MAAALFGQRVAQDDVRSADVVTVSSAGLLPGGFASPSEVVAVMSERDIDLAGHVSTQVSTEIVGDADLVLGLGRRHAREVALLDPGAWPRTFTVKEIVRRGEQVGPRGPAEPLERWLGRLHHGRARTDLVGSSPADDVADPIGGPTGAYRTTAADLAGLVDSLAGLLWAPRPIRPLPG